MTPCETCGSDNPVGVACVPGVPYSAAYCQACLDAGAHPWNILVANTVCVGSLELMAPWWRELVNNTCTRLGRTLEEFEADVRRCAEQMQNDLLNYNPPPVEDDEFEGL